MKSHKERMLGGELYDPLDAQLSAERRRARRLTKALNDTSDDQQEERARLIKELIGAAGEGVWIEPPFYCDYGSNITLGDRVYFNFNCVVLDVAAVRVGSGVLFGPGVHVYAATHPMRAAERRTGLEAGKPVEIGDEVWVGGGAIICPWREDRPAVGDRCGQRGRARYPRRCARRGQSLPGGPRDWRIAIVRSDSAEATRHANRAGAPPADRG
jgi:maltose O-acetyltransferase